MFYIVESDEYLERIYNFRSLGAYVEVISSNDNYHPSLTYPVAIYIRPKKVDEGFIIPIQHGEGLNVSLEKISSILKQYKILYVLNKKNFLYHFPFGNVVDLSLLSLLGCHKKLELPLQTPTYRWFYSKLGKRLDINAIIPLTKLYEDCEERYEKIKHLLELEDFPKGFHFQNTVVTNTFFYIEREGIRVDLHGFTEKFKPQEIEYGSRGETVYGSYNLYNITGRPSNAFNSVNFAAIPKDIEYRKVFNPKNSYFVELDFDGYHLRLLGELIGYKFTEESAHRQLAKLYFKKEEIGEEEYAKAKAINFKTVYGHIPEEYKDLEFSKKVQEFIDKLWKEWEETGQVVVPISGRVFSKELEDMHPQKILNYVIQNLETSRNVKRLVEVFRFLQGKKSKVVLYTYDAIVLDYSEEDGDIVPEIKQILEEGGYPVKIKKSKNLLFN